MEKIQKRSEIKKEYTWATEDIFASDELWLEELADCEKYVEEVSSYKGKISKSAADLYEYMQLGDELNVRLTALLNYAERRHDEDTTVGKYQDMCTKGINLWIRISDASSFDSVEILSIDDETLERFLGEEPRLRGYERALYLTRRRREHILSEAEEALLAKASQLFNAGSDISSALSDADMTFPDVEDKDGEKHPLTNGTYISYLQSSDRVLRKNAFEALYKRYSENKNTFSATLDAQVKQLIFRAKARHFENTLESALFYNEVPTSVYKNLINTVNANLSYMYDYVALRKKLLGYDELHMYDLYVPVVEGADSKIPFESAKETVLKALAPLGEDYLSILKKGLESRWIDIYENEGKRGGAYSAGAKPHPYVLLNYTDTLDDEFTLAHEMGHALHSYYSDKNQPAAYSDYVIFVAEVASTCNEVLLTKYLLNNTSDKKSRAYIINHFLEQFRGTLYRQTMFAEFEMKINELAEANNALTSETLNELYYGLVKKYHGEGIAVDESIKYEWERIPHFYMNFYVFQYATGFSAAVALANKILSEGDEAVKNYKKFLSSGCSTDPISLLKIAGVDMSTPKPIEEALELFSELIEEMNKLTK